MYSTWSEASMAEGSSRLKARYAQHSRHALVGSGSGEAFPLVLDGGVPPPDGPPNQAHSEVKVVSKKHGAIYCWALFSKTGNMKLFR